MWYVSLHGSLSLYQSIYSAMSMFLYHCRSLKHIILIWMTDLPVTKMSSSNYRLQSPWTLPASPATVHQLLLPHQASPDPIISSPSQQPPGFSYLLWSCHFPQLLQPLPRILLLVLCFATPPTQWSWCTPLLLVQFSLCLVSNFNSPPVLLF